MTGRRRDQQPSRDQGKSDQPGRCHLVGKGREKSHNATPWTRRLRRCSSPQDKINQVGADSARPSIALTHAARPAARQSQGTTANKAPWFPARAGTARIGLLSRLSEFGPDRTPAKDHIKLMFGLVHLAPGVCCFRWSATSGCCDCCVSVKAHHLDCRGWRPEPRVGGGSGIGFPVLYCFPALISGLRRRRKCKGGRLRISGRNRQ